MKKKVLLAKKVDHARWLISYADFMTLLFSFFVVMYAIAASNTNKYHLLVESVDSSFKGKQGLWSQDEKKTSLMTNEVTQTNKINLFESTAAVIQSTLTGLIDKSLVNITATPDWVEVQLPSALLFKQGSTDLKASAEPVIQAVANVFKASLFSIRIEGFTDNVPI